VHFNKKSEPNYESRRLARAEHVAYGGTPEKKCAKHDAAAYKMLYDYHTTKNAEEEQKIRSHAAYAESRKRKYEAEATHEVLEETRGKIRNIPSNRFPCLGDVFTQRVGSDLYGYVVTERWLDAYGAVIKIGAAKATNTGTGEWTRSGPACEFFLKNQIGMWSMCDRDAWVVESKGLCLGFGRLENYLDPCF
jgi:hypothetical protein